MALVNLGDQPVISRNPILDELDQAHAGLSQPAKRALVMGMPAGLPLGMPAAAPAANTLAQPSAARPTGGLAPLLFGYHEGGIGGALAAIGATEGIASPEFKLGLGRGLYSSGRSLGSPAGASAATLVPLARRRQPQAAPLVRLSGSEGR